MKLEGMGNGHLTSSNTTHFQSLHPKSHVPYPYEEMLFFDDCNWGDHVQDVEDSFIRSYGTEDA